VKKVLVFIGLLLLIAGCAANPTPTAEPIPTSTPVPVFRVEFIFTQTSGNKIKCPLLTNRLGTLGLPTLKQKPNLIFAVILPNGSECGMIPMDDQGNIIIQSWEATAQNIGTEPAQFDSITLAPGESHTWNQDNTFSFQKGAQA
jgi:hypothetical protein